MKWWCTSIRFAAGFCTGACACAWRTGNAAAAAKPVARNWRRPMQQPQGAENTAILVPPRSVGPFAQLPARVIAAVITAV